jgi:hypothetical protein
MLRAMGFWSRLRETLAGPAHVQGGAEEGSALHEEYGTPSAGDNEMKEVEKLERSEIQDAPLAAAPFAGEGQIRAAEIETELVKPEDVTPDDAEITSDETPPADLDR